MVRGDPRGEQRARREPVRDGVLPGAGGGHPAEAHEEHPGRQPAGIGPGEPDGAVAHGVPVDGRPGAERQERQRRRRGTQRPGSGGAAR
ncbi:hypothetical protein ACIF8T_14835 [Streptomyces sp. NPDC085946]|uniref:hypothetical protein n=1 Tax=Streptomyces sp. NPDC085946 TaxID=3365744 RepID=UPI0037CE4A4B